MSFHDEARAAYDARRNAIEALRGKVEEIGSREFTPEEVQFVERANADIDALDKRIDQALESAKMEERSAKLDALIGERKAEDKEEVSGLESEARSLFGLGKNESMELKPEARDLVGDVSGDGPELVPTTLFGQIYKGLLANGTSMFSLGRSVVTPSGEQMDFPIMSSLSTAALVSAQGDSISESDPQFTTVSLDAYKYALAIQVASELVDDNAVSNMLPMVVEQAIDGIRRGVGAHLLTGTGSSQPNGVDNGSNVVTATGIVSPTAANLISAYHDINENYRRNAQWIFNDATVADIRSLVNAGATDYVWQPGLSAGTPDTLLGKPVVTDSNVAVAGANAKVGLFGDFKRGYLVRTVGSIRAERSVDYAFLNDLVTFRFIGRFDGEIIDNNAFTVLTNEAS